MCGWLSDLGQAIAAGERIRPWAWLAIAAGAFLMGLHSLRVKPTNGMEWAQVEPAFGRRRSPSPSASAHQFADSVVDVDVRDPWRAPAVALDSASIARPNAWSLAVLNRIEWRRFETLCEAMLQHEGHITGSQAYGADGGVDIRLYGDATRQTLTGIVQCKHWSGRVGEVTMREFLGLKTDHQVQTALFIASSGFLPGAQDLARRHDFTLLDGAALLQRIQALPAEVQQRLLAVATEGDYMRPTCVECGTKMVLNKKKSNGNPFWGCGRFPRCKHTMPARHDGASA
ncbi:MAG: restriction endonuclease [Proteobacteria bacterium]|nr:restriction endonuclease [Pseudomonadota bacterium]